MLSIAIPSHPARATQRVRAVSATLSVILDQMVNRTRADVTHDAPNAVRCAVDEAAPRASRERIVHNLSGTKNQRL